MLTEVLVVDFMLILFEWNCQHTDRNFIRGSACYLRPSGCAVRLIAIWRCLHSCL